MSEGHSIRMFINQFVPSVYSSPLVGNTTHDQCVVDDLSGPQSSLQCQDHSRCLSTEASLVLIFVNFCTTSPVCLGYVIPAEQSATARTYIRGQVLVTLATHSQRDIRLISLHTESSIHSPRDIPEPSARTMPYTDYVHLTSWRRPLLSCAPLSFIIEVGITLR